MGDYDVRIDKLVRFIVGSGRRCPQLPAKQHLIVYSGGDDFGAEYVVRPTKEKTDIWFKSQWSNSNRFVFRELMQHGPKRYCRIHKQYHVCP